MTAVALSAQELTTLRAAVVSLEQYMKGPAAQALAARAAFWRSLQSSAARVPGGAQLLERLVGPQLMTLHKQADGNALEYVRMLRALDAGELRLAAWSDGGEQAPGPTQLGVVRRDTDPKALGQWQLAPVIIRVATQAALAVGAWVLANAWTTSKELEGQAAKLRADTANKISATIASVAQNDPQLARDLAGALATANKAASAATPGILDQLASSFRDITETVRESSGGIGMLVLLWFAMQFFGGGRRTA